MKNKRKTKKAIGFLMRCIFLISVSFNAYAQKTVTGEVKDEQGGPLPGVTIVIKGTNSGVTTDFDGLFSINADKGDVLVFSFIGMTTQDVVVGGQSIINVTLAASDIGLDEVVVTALGISKSKKSLGYAVSSVEPEEFNVNKSANILNSLTGKIAGVNITPMGTGAQGSTKIRIRGVSSFGNNNSPLIVVNGMPINNRNFGNTGSTNTSGELGTNRRSDSGDGLSSINPDDVVSMTVLKGGAASALYGSRAKDGVIMITTKNGSEGKGFEVQLNSNYTNGTPLDFTDFQYEYGQGINGERPTTPNTTTGVWSFGEKIEPGMTHVLFDGLEVPYVAQRNRIRDYYQNESTFTNTLTISNGSENGGFNLSASNLDNKAILPGSSYVRNTINLGFNAKHNKLTITGNINYSHEDRENPPNTAEQDYSPVSIYTLSNTMPLDLLRDNAVDEFGNEIKYSRFTNRTNPYFSLLRFEHNKRDRIFGNITARYDINDWLYAQGRVGQDYFTRDVEYNLPTGAQRQKKVAGFENGYFATDILRNRELNADFLFGANKKFNDFEVTANAGGNLMYSQARRTRILGQNFFTRGLYTIANASKVTNRYSFGEKQVNSLYGSAEIGYKNYLYINATVRNDWFSTLAPANRSILYPSITGSYIFSSAMKSKPSWLNYGKLRLAYSEVGSDSDVGPYANNLNYNVSGNPFPNNSGTGQPTGGVSSGVIPNPNLSPMRVSEYEVGLEMTLFSNLRIEGSYYNKVSSDQILNAQISNTSGYGTQRINVGESMNEGVEMLLSGSPIKNDNFEWNITANATYNRSEVLSLGDDVEGTFMKIGDGEFHGELRQEVGKPMGQLYGYGWLRDEQGRVVHDASGKPAKSKEKLAWGGALPTWWGGFTNQFNYKDLSLSFLIDFKLGHNVISGTWVNAYRHGLDKGSLPGRDVGYIIGEGVDRDGNVNTTQINPQSYYETIRSHRGVEGAVFNAGSWQLRQITIGYDFTKILESTKFIKSLRLSAVANNVAVLKSWIPHLHPDQNGMISDTESGLEATGLPITRSIGFNLNVKF